MVKCAICECEVSDSDTKHIERRLIGSPVMTSCIEISLFCYVHKKCSGFNVLYPSLRNTSRSFLVNLNPY